MKKKYQKTEKEPKAEKLRQYQNNIGTAYFDLGHLSKAKEFLHASLGEEDFIPRGDTLTSAVLLSNYGVLLNSMDEHEEAFKYLRKAEDILTYFTLSDTASLSNKMHGLATT